MLKVENLSTGYGKKQVLFDVSFEVNQGDIVLLAGSNGSGKSTLLKTIYGLLPIWNDGKNWFLGENITGKQTVELLRRGLLYIPQKNNLFEDLTVQENLEMAGLTLGKKLVKQRIEEVLTTFHVIVAHLKKTPMKLSGGERQLLAITMATLHHPKLMLLDEPLTGLSPQNINIVVENLKMLKNNSAITIIIVEHRVKEVIRITDKILGLKLGKITNEIEVNQVFNFNQNNSLFV
ncbi:MAG: ATP-binding cassette domain-containing protein [Bacteroidetes bacterium]|nr:ATP-binding cassette domain-containing protein [Bacteroidota bacterium]